MINEVKVSLRVDELRENVAQAIESRGFDELDSALGSNVQRVFVEIILDERCYSISLQTGGPHRS